MRKLKKRISIVVGVTLVSLFVTVAAFGQNKYIDAANKLLGESEQIIIHDEDKLNWFAMSDDLEVFVALNVIEGEKFINFNMYESKKVLTYGDTIYYAFNGEDTEFSITYPQDVDLSEMSLQIFLTDQEAERLKFYGLEFFSINDKHYYFSEDKNLITKAAKNIF